MNSGSTDPNSAAACRSAARAPCTSTAGPVRSCVFALSRVGDSAITTLEGLGSPAAPHPLQQAFLDEQAGECAYCANGMLMVAAALLTQNPTPTTADVQPGVERQPVSVWVTLAIRARRSSAPRGTSA